MTFSEAASATAPAPADTLPPLPPAIPSMWRVCKLGYRHEPGLMLGAFATTVLSGVPDTLLALWIAYFGQGLLDNRPGLVLLGAIGLGVSVTLTWLLDLLSQRIGRRFRDKVSINLEGHVARLQATISTVAHHERPEILDRLSVLRNQVFVLEHMYMSLFTTTAWVLRLVITMTLLAAVHPALIALALFAVPTILTSSWRPAVERAAQERGAQAYRLARHLFNVATTAAPAKELRVLGIASRVAAERRATWERGYAPIAAARWASAAWHAAAWLVFGLAYVGAVAFTIWGLGASTGSVLLVLAAGSRLAFYVSHTVGEIGFLRGIWMDGARRLAWLEQYAAAAAAAGHDAAPDALERGIRFENVSFVYPGTTRTVLDRVTLDLPAGAVVAVVGENGAGKTTLVKLLAKMYEPVEGTIYVDGRPLSSIAAESWRTRLAGAFQDFFRFELRAQHSIGLGDLPRLDDRPAVSHAVARAGADDVVGRLRAGLETQLGATWPDGVDLSFGQWQKLALARGVMREAPLLLILDEPTAALDAETEHALFERYAAAARGGGAAARSITLLVSHRFSTVRMADLIVVLDGARLVEVGAHDELMARGGQYAQLYTIQATAYR